MEPRGSIVLSQGLSNNPYLSRINPISPIETYFFKILSEIVLPKGLFPVELPVKILKALLRSSILAT